MGMFWGAGYRNSDTVVSSCFMSSKPFQMVTRTNLGICGQSGHVMTRVWTRVQTRDHTYLAKATFLDIEFVCLKQVMTGDTSGCVGT